MHTLDSTSVDTCISFSGPLMTTITSPVDWTDLSCIFMTFISIRGGNFTQMGLMVKNLQASSGNLDCLCTHPLHHLIYCTVLE